MTNAKRKMTIVGAIAALCLLCSLGLFGCGQSNNSQTQQQTKMPTAEELLAHPFGAEDPNYTEMTLYMDIIATTDTSGITGSALGGYGNGNSSNTLQSMETKLNVVAPIQASQSNNTSYMNMQMNMDVMGITANINMEQYAVADKDTGTIDQYVKQTGTSSLFGDSSDNAGWQKTTASLSQADMDMMSTINSLSDVIENPTITEEDDAYVVKGTISTNNAMSSLISEVSSSSYATSEDDIKFTIVLTYDKKTQTLTKMTFEYDTEFLKEIEAQSSTKFDKFDVYMTVDNFNNTDEVTIPQEVIASANSTSGAYDVLNGSSSTNTSSNSNANVGAGVGAGAAAGANTMTNGNTSAGGANSNISTDSISKTTENK